MEISRIFWEKATAIHVYCLQGKEKLAGRFSRHLHDLARLRETGHAAEAISARTVAETVADPTRWAVGWPWRNSPAFFSVRTALRTCFMALQTAKQQLSNAMEPADG
jgi:hypothetical protein